MKGDVFLVSVHLIWEMLWICYVIVIFASVFPETICLLGKYIVIISALDLLLWLISSVSILLLVAVNEGK